MIPVSAQFKALALLPSRTWQIYATIGANTYTQTDIVDFTLESLFSPSGYLIFGGAPSRKLTIKLDGTRSIPTDQPIKLFCGLNDEFIQLGSFYVDTPATTYSTISTTFVGYDKMVKYADIPFDSSTLGDNLTLDNLYQHLRTIIDVDDINTPDMPSGINILNPIRGSVRDLILDIAELANRTTHVNIENGYLSFPPFQLASTVAANINANHYINFKLNSLEKIKIDTLKSGESIVGGKQYGTYEINNDNLTFERLSQIAASFPLEYYAYTLEMQGMPHIQAGDLITLTDVYNDFYELNVGSHILTYNGTLKSTISAAAPDNSIVSINRGTKTRVDKSNSAINDNLNSLVDEVRASTPSPIPAGADITKLYLTPNDKLYIIQMIAEATVKSNELRNEASPQNMFYLQSGALKTSFDSSFVGLTQLTIDYPFIQETETISEITDIQVAAINKVINDYVAASKNLSSYLLKFFKNESGNTIIDSNGVHIGTFEGLPTTNQDGSYFDVGGIEKTFTVNIATNAVFTCANHGLKQGDIIFLSTTGSLPNGLSRQRYWVSPINTTTFRLSESETKLAAADYVDTSGTQSGIHAFYTGGANSRLTSTALQFKYGRDVKVSIEADKTRIVNAQLDGISTINNQVFLPESIVMGNLLTVEKGTNKIRINFL